jgi:hypothetical protein
MSERKIKDRELEIPAVYRSQGLKKVVNGDFAVVEPVDLDGEDLDVPTFLRRQAD